MSVKILFVEDDERLRDVLMEAAAMEGYDARGVSSAEAAVELLRDEPFEVMVTDVTLPDMLGLDLLQHCLRLRPGILPIVITAYGTADIAVEAMRRGAAGFITKPFALEELLGLIRAAVEGAAVLSGAAAEVHLQDLPEEVRDASSAVPTAAAEETLARQPTDPPDAGIDFDAERDSLSQSEVDALLRES